MPEYQEDPFVIYWRIYYGDYTNWSSSDGSWQDAPDDDVQIVVLWRMDTATRMMSGADYYWCDPLHKDPFGRTNDHGETHGDLKTGKWVSDEDFDTIRLIATNDAQFFEPPLSPE